MSTAGIFSSLLTARSSEAVTRFFKREELNKNYENAKFVLFIGLIIDFITAMMLVLLIYISAEFVSITFLKDESLQQEIILYSIVVFFGFLRGAFMGFLQSQELFKEINTITIVESFLKVTFLLLKPYLFYQNIQYFDAVLVSFFILAIYYILPLFTWWGRNFIILYNPTLPIYSNLLLSINSIWIPIVLFQLNYFDGLTTICLGILLAFIPSWLFAPIIYLKFMKKEKVIR